MIYFGRVLRKFALLIGAAALFYGISWILLRSGAGSKIIFPDIVHTWAVLLKDGPELGKHFLVTIREFIQALAVIVLISAGSAGAMAVYRAYLPAFERFSVYAFSIPIIVWYPLLTVWLGLGSAPKVAYGVIAGAFPVVIALARGFGQIDWRYIDFGRSLRLSPPRIAVLIAIPMIIPYIVGSLRVAVALCFISIVVAEMIASVEGLGYYISFHRTLLNADNVYLGILIAMLIITLANSLFDMLEVRLAQDR